MTRRIPKWVLVALALLLPACSSETAVFGPAETIDSAVPAATGLREDLPGPGRVDAVTPSETEPVPLSQMKGNGRFTRYAMAAS